MCWLPEFYSLPKSMSHWKGERKLAQLNLQPKLLVDEYLYPYGIFVLSLSVNQLELKCYAQGHGRKTHNYKESLEAS
ncbi:unnamed protein product [Moneuplotes crassus]|uniref:Uncharacterized protein n=1 Tax=Euplotes crassus TaxID=5936 RepID=A0AAD1US77_EUPCR|nr:unnamed protein product [Moneuplotes crassus]